MKKTTFTRLLLLLFFICLAAGIFAQPEFLDNSFGAAGRQTLRLPADDQVYNLVIQPDGKIIAAGTSFEGETYRYSLVRYLPDGSLDPAFGLNGKNHTLLPDDISGSADAVALQSNGNIVVLERLGNLIRYLPNGQPDPLFANPLKLDYLDHYYGLAVGPGDKILLAGYLAAFPEGFAIARLLPNGALDGTFGDGGVTTFDFGAGSERAVDVAVQPDGKIVACGRYDPPAGSSDLIVVRLNPNGTPDNSFSMDGRLLIDGDSVALSARTLMLRPDGKIVVGVYGAGLTSFTSLFRFNPDGNPDDSFGTGGEVRVDGLYTYDFAQAPDGSIFVSGGQSVLKFTASGVLDTGFGDAGILHPTLAPYHIAVQADSTIVVASTLESDFALTSYLPGGGIAPAFNNGAVVVTNIGRSGGTFHKLALQPDGKILAGGTNLDDQLAIVRLEHDGSPDNGFRARTWNGGAEDGYSLNALALQSDGKVLAAGDFYFLDSQVGFLFRFLPDGALDSSFSGSAGDPVVALALQPDGKILTTDFRKSGSFTWVSSLHRYQADGTPDPSFGINGTVDSKPYLWGHLALQADGKVLVAGTTVFRYQNDGAPDSTFGTNGSIQVSGWSEFLTLLPDGKFLLARNTSTDFEISRYLQDGSTDAGFGTAGKKLLPLGDGGIIHAMGVQPDGKILLAGEITDGQGFADFLLVRLLPDGSPDTSAGSGGFVTTNFEGLFADDHAYALAVQPDGKIILSGTSLIVTDSSAYTAFSLARYRADLSVEAKEVYGAPYPLTITPNPVGDALRLSLPETAEVQVFDAQGRLMLRRTLAVGQALDVQGLPAGVYVVRALAGGRGYAGRFVKG